MRVAVLVMLVLAGCQPPPAPIGTDGEMFTATSMRLHPIFTRIRDWSGDGTVDGVEAELEFLDRFQDPTKASGTVIFELHEFRAASADPRGPRVVEPWAGSLASLRDQQTRWNRTSRTYGFQLAYDGIRPERGYVLSATFQRGGGGRFFDRVVLRPYEQEKRSGGHEQSVTQPGERTPEP